MDRNATPAAVEPVQRPESPVDPVSWIAVTEALVTYFDGLYHGDTDKLARVFHPGAVYATATEGELLRMTTAEYFRAVRPQGTAPGPA
ncbi:nuclear transport factor 2 family protein [Streptomyces sp. NPDC002187]|uniref:nuclear transport factor 2 family protein n=1 Tax=Streptomyces sp. NPDC002187 TaxID=3364637 RepID=UPI0036927467